MLFWLVRLKLTCIFTLTWFPYCYFLSSGRNFIITLHANWVITVITQSLRQSHWKRTFRECACAVVPNRIFNNILNARNSTWQYPTWLICSVFHCCKAVCDWHLIRNTSCLNNRSYSCNAFIRADFQKCWWFQVLEEPLAHGSIQVSWVDADLLEIPFVFVMMYI